MSNMVRYGSFTAEAVDQVASAADVISGNVIMDLGVGENIIRVVPPKVGMSSPMRVTAMHYVEAMPGIDRMLVFACPRVELKQPCIVCQKSEEMGRSANPLDREKAYSLSAGLRVYMNVVDRKVPLASGQKILAFGKMILNGLKEIRKNPRLGGDYTDPTERGFDLIVSREGTGMQTKYAVHASRDASPLAPTVEEMQYLIDNQYDLESYVKPIVPEELMQIWSQVRGQVPQSYQAPQAQQMHRQALPQAGPTPSQQLGQTGQVGARFARTPAPVPSAVQDAQADDKSWLDE